MAAKKLKGQKLSKRGSAPVRSQDEAALSEPRGRQRRTDEEKIRLVRQVIESGNQSAEIKKLGIYPNQFYDWKKRFAPALGMNPVSVIKRRGEAMHAARSVAEEAKAFIEGKAALLDRLRTQRSELDQLINQLEG